VVEEICWRVSRGCKLLWKRWDDEFIVFNSGSRDTHLLDCLTGLVLKAIEEAPSTLTDLKCILSAMPGVDVQQDTHHYLLDLLTRLDDLGLIEPIAQ
jgi:PqqD family protein of HPr-rel-A system